jgi:hypothetical protein
MSTVVHKVTLDKRESVNTPDFDPAIWLINPDHADAPKHHVRLNSTRDNLELKSEAEIESADEVKFSELKDGMASFFRGQYQNEREKRYELDTLLYAQYLLFQAAVSMNEEVTEYLTPLADWIVDGDKLVRVVEEAALAATTEEELNAVSIDFSEWLGADPGVSVRLAETM